MRNVEEVPVSLDCLGIPVSGITHPTHHAATWNHPPDLRPARETRFTATHMAMGANPGRDDRSSSLPSCVGPHASGSYLC
jgi:hypothetical protein